MSLTDLTTLNTGQTVALVLSFLLLSASIAAWTKLVLWFRSTGKIWPEWCDEPRTDWTRFPEVTVVLLVLLLISLYLLPMFEPQPAEPIELTMNALIIHAIFTGGLGWVLIAILVGSGQPPSVYGMKLYLLPQQIMDGITGYLLALLPMSVLMLATAPFRNAENRNSLLTLLADNPDMETLAAIGFTAVILAPFYEELLFRVVLQSWLTAEVDPRWSIPLTAMLFGAIHGLPDGIALLPLAGILGYVFYQRHSYVSVLVIHGLFNGTMLVLALLTQ